MRARPLNCQHTFIKGRRQQAYHIQLTRQLREAAAAVGIPLLDHVIIGRRGADPLGRGALQFQGGRAPLREKFDLIEPTSVIR
jgi:DNA repair protein RadC